MLRHPRPRSWEMPTVRLSGTIGPAAVMRTAVGPAAHQAFAFCGAGAGAGTGAPALAAPPLPGGPPSGRDGEIEWP